MDYIAVIQKSMSRYPIHLMYWVSGRHDISSSAEGSKHALRPTKFAFVAGVGIFYLLYIIILQRFLKGFVIEEHFRRVPLVSGHRTDFTTELRRNI